MRLHRIALECSNTFGGRIVMKKMRIPVLISMGLCLCLGVCAALLFTHITQAGQLYLIRDRDRILLGQYRTSDPLEALDAAGVTLSPEDRFTAEATSGATEISICRSLRLTLSDGGAAAPVDTRAETVGALLEEAGVQLGALDRVEPGPEAPLTEGMTVAVTRVREEEITAESSIDFVTVSREDDNLPLGEQTVLSEGAPGLLARTIRAVYENGQIVSREILRETVLKAPRDRVLLVGTRAVPVYAQAAPVIQSGTITTASGEVYTYSRVMAAEATAYSCEGYQGTTATGTPARYGAIAVDPTVIPYGTRMYIVTDDGEFIYGVATAEDCGGAVVGNIIDLYFDTFAECYAFGRRACTVYFLD